MCKRVSVQQVLCNALSQRFQIVVQAPFSPVTSMKLKVCPLFPSLEACTIFYRHGRHASFFPALGGVREQNTREPQPENGGKRIHDQRGVHSPNPHSMASKLLPPTTFSVEHGVQFSREITQHVIDVFEECILGACTVEQTETNISRHSSKTRTNDDETETGWPIQCKDWYSKGPCIYKTTIYMSTNGNFKNLEANYIIHIWYH